MAKDGQNARKGVKGGFRSYFGPHLPVSLPLRK